MENLRHQFVPTLRKSIDNLGIEQTLGALDEMIIEGHYATVTELIQGLKSEMYEHDKYE